MKIDTKRLRELVDAPHWPSDVTEQIAESLPYLLDVYEAAERLVDGLVGVAPSTPSESVLVDAVNAARKGPEL